MLVQGCNCDQDTRPRFHLVSAGTRRDTKAGSILRASEVHLSYRPMRHCNVASRDASSIRNNEWAFVEFCNEGWMLMVSMYIAMRHGSREVVTSLSDGRRVTPERRFNIQDRPFGIGGAGQVWSPKASVGLRRVRRRLTRSFRARRIGSAVQLR